MVVRLSTHRTCLGSHSVLSRLTLRANKAKAKSTGACKQSRKNHIPRKTMASWSQVQVVFDGSPDVKTRISQMTQQVPGVDNGCREAKPGNGIITLVSSRPWKECSSAIPRG
ncbi:hypothetical protein CEXT_52701 [Caerostris extrusa]|uniref:Uncharacterized protein n=1 Tax=Caerostris extrusa TaxID=172846 RepID=A0AAV4TRL3_CAEEX|nr:hypothetical protein CEXT_52701 [Caerostris extrusa]